MIKRRHVIYVHGYDPQGAAGYYRLFEREWKKFKTTWSVTSDLGKLEIDSDDFAHWTVTTSGPNWTVETRYDFLRYDDALKSNLSQPLHRQVARAVRWIVNDLVTGTTARIIRATWRFWLHLFIPQLGLLLWLAVAATAGWFAAQATLSYLAMPFVVALVSGVVAAVLVFLALRPVAERWFIIRLNNAWPYMHEFGRGQPTFYDRPIAACAARIKEAAADKNTDEVLVIGHSGGGLITPSMLARALELDPDLGKHGPRVVLMTLGSLFPAVALHPKAEPLRNVVRRLAIEPSIRWIDCQSRKDVMNFWEFDLVTGLGLDLGAPRHNPRLWPVRFRDIVSEQYYQHLRKNLLRLHYQFIMSGDLRAPYNFFMLTCGPLPAEEWATRTWEALKEFSPDTAYRAGAISSAPPEARAALRTNEG